MFVGNTKDMPKIDMTPGGAKGAWKQVAVGPEQGWDIAPPPGQFNGMPNGTFNSAGRCVIFQSNFWI